MNKVILVLIFSTITACMGKHTPAIPAALVNEGIVKERSLTNIDSFFINPAFSTIEWKATEMRGIRLRTGKILFKSGYILKKNDSLAGGRFIVDMESMDVTDVPANEKVARKNLLNHLKADDFFNTALYPTSTFEITNVQQHSGSLYHIQGNLTIREVTRNISFTAIQQGEYYVAAFTFDRFLWKIAYEGSLLNKTLIDKTVSLNIALHIPN